MSKLKDKLKASISPESAKPEAPANPVMPDSKAHAAVSEAQATLTPAVEKKPAVARPVKVTAQREQVDAGHCTVWPD